MIQRRMQCAPWFSHHDRMCEENLGVGDVRIVRWRGSGRLSNSRTLIRRPRKYFRSLSAQQRAIAYLTYWEDLAPQVIANLLNISEGSVKRQLARARSNLRKALA
jgi:DNA-directed RNA polymerase specialized sigma24 family protein